MWRCGFSSAKVVHKKSKFQCLIILFVTRDVLSLEQKIRIKFQKVPWCLQAYQVLWFGGGATCTPMYMLCILVAVHYL